MVRKTRKNKLRNPDIKLEKTHIMLQKTGKKDQCQCTSSCTNKSLPNSSFCSVHQKACPRVSPLSGYEPDYNPDHWNNNYKIKETHNCFAYAFNVNDEEQIKKCKDETCDFPFHQPGMASGYERFKSGKPKTCPNMAARLFGDNHNIKMTTFTEKCPPGTSKIALIVDEDEDYHFLRQDSNGYWSHKPGARKVTNLDASGKKIYDPALGNYNYKKNANGYLNYDNFCGYMCVPRVTPIRIKTGGSRRIVKLIVYFNFYRGHNSIIVDCPIDGYELVYIGNSGIDEYEKTAIYNVEEDKIKDVKECIERVFKDNKSNKVVKKYKVITELNSF